MIQDRVNFHASFVEGKYLAETRFFTALQGSQNYGISDKLSDVDTKTLILPSLPSMIFSSKGISKTLIIEPEGEHADVKDVKDMFENFRKQNLNFIEILFSDYANVNPSFLEEYNALIDMREKIAHMNLHQTLMTNIGCINQKIKKIRKNLFENNSTYDSKALSSLLQRKFFLEDFFEKEKSFKESMFPCFDKRTILLNTKRHLPPFDFSTFEVEGIVNEAEIWANNFFEKWNRLIRKGENRETLQKMNELIYKLYKKNIKGELKDE